MTINSTTRKAGPFVGNGTVSAFPFGFKVFQASDLFVVRLNVSAAVEQTLVLNSDYSVTLNPDQNSNPGGVVTLSSALASGYTLTLTSDVPDTQPTDLTNQGGFYPEVINDALDRATIQIQQMQTELDRSFKVAISSSTDPSLPPAIPGSVLGWNATGDALINIAASTGTSLADLAASAGSSLIGYNQGGAGAVDRTVQNRLQDYVSVKDFGAVGDGVTDDTAAIQAAIDYAQTIKAWLYFPPVEYAYMVTGLDIGVIGTNYTCHFLGGGFDPSMASQAGITGQYTGQSMIKLIAGSNRSLITVGIDAAPPQFKNMTLSGNGSAQSGTSYCLELTEAAAAAYYRYAAWMEDCLISDGRTGGLFIGSNRGAGYYSNVWVQYCGRTSTDIAVNVRCFDQQFNNVQIGPNPGVGMYLGFVTQIQLSNCVMFMNYVGLRVAQDVGLLQAVNCAFDSNQTYGTDVAGGTQDGGRQFTGCHWRRNGLAAYNTYADIRIDSDRLISLTDPVFSGSELAGIPTNKYAIEFQSGSQTPLLRLSNPIAEDASGAPTYINSFTNNFSYLILAGTLDAYIGKPGGNQTLSGMIGGLEKWRTDVSGTNFLARLYPPGDDGALQTDSALSAGLGAPSNAFGVNGDYYFRSDGGAGSRIYFKTGGAWTAIL